MTILFDLWVINPAKMQNVSYEEDILFKTIWDFVYDRIYFLHEDIDLEEAAAPESTKCIMIELICKRLSFHGYSEGLTAKLKGCFNKNDEQVLAQRFDEAFSYLN